MAESVKKTAILLFIIVSLLLPLIPITQATDYNTLITIDAYDETEAAALTGTPVAAKPMYGVWINQTSPGAGWYIVTYGGVPITFYANATDEYGNPLKGFKVNGILNLGSSWVLTTAEYPTLTVTAWYANETSGGGGGYIPGGGTTGNSTTTSGTGQYTFIGLNDEDSGNLIPANGTTVTAYLTGHTPEAFFVNGTAGYNSSIVQYFSFDLGNGETRQYWPTANQTTATIYITNSTLTTYVINFMDQTGILKSNPYISAQTYVNGSLVTVEKRKVDSLNSITMNLQLGKKYNFVIESDTGASYNYGEVLMTAVTGVQLILRGVDFPKESLLLYKYVHAFVNRTYLNPIGEIDVNFDDIKNQTTSVFIEIKYTNGTVANSTTITDQRFNYMWTEAVNATSYQVVVTVTHSIYGTFYFRQYLIGEYTTPDDPFSLAAFGSIPGLTSTAWIIPALIIIFAAACFSELTAEVACVLTAVVAVILTVIGWLPITTSALVIALSFGIMAGVITVRRRFW